MPQDTRHAPPMRGEAHDEAVEKLWSMIREVKIAMLVTRDAAGELRARPMANQQADAFDGSLWFFTYDDSPKVGETARDHEVCAAFADASRQNYASVSGHARIVRDKAKIHELWSEALATWFPKGKDDPRIALIQVEVHKGEYWDAPSSTMVHAYGYAKAKLTGEPPSPGDHGKVGM
jgi:general stress protein 26